MGSSEWHEDAACRHLFHYFDVADDLAYTTCEACPVRIACRDYALNHKPRITEGIWGGWRFEDGKRWRLDPPGTTWTMIQS